MYVSLSINLFSKSTSSLKQIDKLTSAHLNTPQVSLSKCKQLWRRFEQIQSNIKYLQGMFTCVKNFNKLKKSYSKWTFNQFQTNRLQAANQLSWISLSMSSLKHINKLKAGYPVEDRKEIELANSEHSS